MEGEGLLSWNEVSLELPVQCFPTHGESLPTCKRREAREMRKRCLTL